MVVAARDGAAAAAVCGGECVVLAAADCACCIRAYKCRLALLERRSNSSEDKRARALSKNSILKRRHIQHNTYNTHNTQREGRE